MPNYDMNNTVQEPDRTLIDRGFNGMFHETQPQTSYEYEGLGPPPGQLTHPLTNEVDTSADSKRIDIGPSAHDITVRSR